MSAVCLLQSKLYNNDSGRFWPRTRRAVPGYAKTTPYRKGRVMAWFILVIAGLIEAGWAIGLKYTDGFTKLVPSLLTSIGIVASLVLLAFAARTLPIGTAYAVWVGIGAAGAVVLGILLFGEAANPLRLAFLALLMIAIVGLKFTAH